MDFFFNVKFLLKMVPFLQFLSKSYTLKSFFYFIFDVLLESNNKSTKKKYLVDQDPTKVGSLRGSEGQKVIFLNFLVLLMNFFLFVFYIETNGSSYQIKNKNDRKLIKNFF